MKTWDGNLHDMQQQLSHYKIQTPQRQLEMDSAPTLFQIAPKFLIRIHHQDFGFLIGWFNWPVIGWQLKNIDSIRHDFLKIGSLAFGPSLIA